MYCGLFTLRAVNAEGVPTRWLVGTAQDEMLCTLDSGGDPCGQGRCIDCPRGIDSCVCYVSSTLFLLFFRLQQIIEAPSFLHAKL